MQKSSLKYFGEQLWESEICTNVCYSPNFYFLNLARISQNYPKSWSSTNVCYSPNFYFLNMARISQNYPKFSSKSWGNFCSPSNPAELWERRGNYIFFFFFKTEISLQPDLFWKKKKTIIIKKSKHCKKIKIDLQWNNIIFIVTATGVPWESRMLEKFNFAKKKEFTSLNKSQGIPQDNHWAAAGIFHPPELHSGSFLIIFSV